MLSDNISSIKNTGLNSTFETDRRLVLEWMVQHPSQCYSTNSKNLYRIAKHKLDISQERFTHILMRLRQEQIIAWTGHGRHNGNYVVLFDSPKCCSELQELAKEESLSMYDEYKSTKKLTTKKTLVKDTLTIENLIEALKSRGGEITIKFERP